MKILILNIVSSYIQKDRVNGSCLVLSRKVYILVTSRKTLCGFPVIDKPKCAIP